MLLLEGRSYVGKWDYNISLSLKKMSFRAVWFMCCKHSQTECLLKNPLICWNMLHRVMLTWRIDSLKQNGPSLSGSLQWHFQLVWMRLPELFFCWVHLCSKCMNFFQYYLELCTKHPLTIYLQKAVLHYPFCLYRNKQMVPISCPVAAGPAQRISCIVQNPCLQNFCNN